jgi:uncharacterized protein YcbX
VWRHPVKSLQGERVDAAEVLESGLAFDRAWGIQAATGHVLTGRRCPALLGASAAVVDEQPRITLPDGTALAGTGPQVDAALSEWLGEQVSLVAAAAVPPAVGEMYADATDDTSELVEWTMPAGRFVDALPLLVLTTSSLRAAASLYPEGDWSSRRFRANIVLETTDDGWVEDGWLKQTVDIGPVAVVPRAPCVRCTMVTRPQPGIARDLDIYKSLVHHHGGTFGVWSTVATPGTVHVGDLATVAPSNA